MRKPAPRGLTKGQPETGVVDFDAEFKERVLGIGHTLAMMAPWDDPLYLKRVWCIFEIFTASQNDCQVTIVMPPLEERAMLNALVGSDEGIDKLYTALAGTKIENAEASVQKDRDRILGMVESTVGFVILNQKVNDLLRKWVGELVHYWVDEVAEEEMSEVSFASLCRRGGDFFSENGELDVALEMHQKALDLCLRIYGKNHDDTELCHSSIAYVLSGKGDYDKALKMHRESLEINLSIHSDKHPKTAECYDGIASVLQLKGDLDGAAEAHREALSIFLFYEMVTGERHPGLAPLLSDMGNLLLRTANFDEALKMFGKALERNLVTYGEWHPSTADSYVNVGVALCAKGNDDEALEHFRRAFNINMKLLGTDHQQTKRAGNYINQMLVLQGNGK